MIALTQIEYDQLKETETRFYDIMYGKKGSVFLRLTLIENAIQEIRDTLVRRDSPTLSLSDE